MASPAVLTQEPRHYEIADVLRDHAHGLRLTTVQARAVRDIVACRTERLGGHLEVCKVCGFARGSYNSCLMESAAFWGARVSSRFHALDLRPIRHAMHSP